MIESIKLKLTSLINDFIVTAKSKSYANKCYNWTLAEAEITSNIFRIYDLLSDEIYQATQKDEPDDTVFEFSYEEWHTIVNYCMGFKVGLLLDEDGVLADRLVAHTNVYYLYNDFERLVVDMCKLKFSAST